MSISVVIPSRKIANLVPCVEAIFRQDPMVEVIVVDDGVDWRGSDLEQWITVIPGAKPFIFSRNCNLGIKAALERDNIVLMNDDAILKTPWGFHKLEEIAEEHPELGLVSAVTNVTGQPSQQPHNIGLRIEPRTVAFVSVFIPRATIARVGLLDERFTAYGYEDNDYCRRLTAAGLKIGILDDCFVDHSSLKSTFREYLPGNCGAGDVGAGRRIYWEKWGAGAI